MAYETIDSIIYPWAQKHSLHIDTNYKDDEVRSIEIIRSEGRRFQIWIDPPLGAQIHIHAWNYKAITKAWKIEINNLESTLEEVLQTVKLWMQQDS